MSDEKNTPTADPAAEHKFFALWAQDDENEKPAFYIKCDCGETVYMLEKDFLTPPEARIYPGMTLQEFQNMHKDYNKFKGRKRQIQRVALAQHAEKFPECPVIVKLKAEAGVDSVQELPNPFRDTQ